MSPADAFRSDFKRMQDDIDRLKDVAKTLERERNSIRLALRQQKKAAGEGGKPRAAFGGAATVETRPCQHCGAVIRRAAKLCKHCKRSQPESFVEIAAIEGEITRLRVEMFGRPLQDEPPQDPIDPAA